MVVDIYALLGVCKECEKFKITKREKFVASYNVPDMQSPFVNIYNDDGEKTNIVLLSTAMNRSAMETYKKYKDKLLFLGITSYLEFPGVISNPFDVFNDPKHETWNFDYSNEMKGWLYSFRNPEMYIKGNKPKILLSESDFADHSIIKPDPSVDKIYDFIYICPKTNKDSDNCDVDWTSYNKNWQGTLEFLEIMCREFGLRGLLVGRKNCELPNICNNMMKTTHFLKWKTLLKRYKQSRFLFVPNIYDASPRVITEALCSDIPIFVNNNILGGWKYVTPETGMGFSNVDDFSFKLHNFLNEMRNYSPRKHFIENYGILNSGRVLLEFIKTNYTGMTNVSRFNKYLTIRFPKPNFSYSEDSGDTNIIDDVENVIKKGGKYILDI